MKITVRQNNTEITVSENEIDETSMRWSGQNKQIQETIIVMAEQVKKLEQLKNN